MGSDWTALIKGLWSVAGGEAGGPPSAVSPLWLVLKSVLFNIVIADLDDGTEGSLSSSANDAESRIIFAHQMIVLLFSDTFTGWGNGLTGIHQSSTESWEGITPCARQGWRLTSLAEKDLCPCTKDNQKPHELGRGLPATWRRWSFPYSQLWWDTPGVLCSAMGSPVKKRHWSKPSEASSWWWWDCTIQCKTRNRETQGFLAVKIYFML